MHYLPHTPLAWAAIGTGWVAIAAALATFPHRAKQALCHADPGEEYTPPPVETWMQYVPVDCIGDRDPILHERFEAIISREWEWSE